MTEHPHKSTNLARVVVVHGHTIKIPPGWSLVKGDVDRYDAYLDVTRLPSICWILITDLENCREPESGMLCNHTDFECLIRRTG